MRLGYGTRRFAEHRLAVKPVWFCAALLTGVFGPADVDAQPVRIRSLSEVARLDGTAIKPEEGFSGVVGAAFLQDESVVVADAGRKSIHRFDKSGRYLMSFGREGSGPGEFMDLLWLRVCIDGTILVFDPALNRISMLDRTGSYVKAVKPPAWFRLSTVLSCDGTDNVVTLHDRPCTRPKERGAVQRYPALIAKGNLFQHEFDTLVVLSGTDYYFGKLPVYVDLPLGAGQSLHRRKGS